MADQELKVLVANGLQAARAGSEVAKQATAEIAGDASHPDLKAALQSGNKTAEQWAQRIEQALQQVGGGEDHGNKIMDAHYEVSRLIRQAAKDATSRDLGIVAAGQLALHYWIAAFGTLASYAGRIGMTEVAQSMHACAEEAKQADGQHTALAEKLMAG